MCASRKTWNEADSHRQMDREQEEIRFERVAFELSQRGLVSARIELYHCTIQIIIGFLFV